MRALQRAKSLIEKEGFLYFVVRKIAQVLRVDLDGVQRVKNKVLKKLVERHDMRVAYGPFRGMKLNSSVWWSKNDLITQMLGVYEEHVMDKLVEFSRSGIDKFIDIGAADGYFCVGAAYGGLFKRVIAFEISLKGQEHIKENASSNQCFDKILVRGEASHSSLSDVLSDVCQSVILIDIEGEEYRFLDEKMLQLFSKHFVICELHPWLVEGGSDEEDSLISRASFYFDCAMIRREVYRPNDFDELSEFNDEERLIAVGEGREKNMNWLVLSPKVS